MYLLTQRWHTEFLTDFFFPVIQISSDTYNLCNITLTIHVQYSVIYYQCFSREISQLYLSSFMVNPLKRNLRTSCQRSGEDKEKIPSLLFSSK